MLRKEGNTIKSKSDYIYIMPFLIGFTMFFVAPLFLAVYYTFDLNGNGIGIYNYVSVFQSPSFQLACWNTLRFIGIGVPLLMVISLMLAIMLKNYFYGSIVFKTILLSPLVVPIATIATLLQVLFSENGIANTIITKIGTEKFNWLHSEWAFVILIVLYIWKNVGYDTLLIIAGLRMIPKELEEAAKIDGASSKQIFAHLTLPLLVPNLCFVAIVSISNSFKSFKETFLLGGDIPDKSIYMLQHFLNNNFNNANYPRLSVAAISLFVVIAFVIWVFLSVIKKVND